MSKKKASTPIASSNRPPTGVIRKNTPQMSFTESSQKEQDERYRYLVRFGRIHKTLNQGNMIFAELGQIPGIWICYRRPKEREENCDKIELFSQEFEHIPLFEGEENLKILNMKHNKIKKIENMVSLPNLLYLDLTDNLITKLENVENLINLRILLIPQNIISGLNSLTLLSKLEVVDLHSNKLKKIDGFENLKKLKILNLADNLIEKIEGLESLENLQELNLKKNQIHTLEKIKNLKNLQKLLICENKITKLVEEELISLKILEEIALDGNEITSMENYAIKIFGFFPILKMLDHKEKNCYFLSEQNGNDKKLSRNAILEIIKDQWGKCLENSIKSKQEKEAFVLESGHAELDMDNSLLIYGNAYKFVLLEESYHKKIKKV